MVESHVPNIKRILFVDDDRDTLWALSRILHEDRHRWEMVFVLGGEAAIDALRGSMFDVVVTDLCMPGIDGFAVLAAAKQQSPGTVRVMLTGSSVDEAAVDAYAVLTKPCSREQLRALLDRV